LALCSYRELQNVPGGELPTADLEDTAVEFLESLAEVAGQTARLPSTMGL